MVLPDSMGSLICRFAMRPGCRRKQLLAHFGEKRGGCDPAVELPCDWCHDPKVGHDAVQRWLILDTTLRSSRPRLLLQSTLGHISIGIRCRQPSRS
jgi:hypothetical protein